MTNLFDLDKSAYSIYTTLLRIGSATLTELHRATKIHRTILYARLPELQEQHLVGTLKRKKTTYFFAQPPEQLETRAQKNYAQAQEQIALLKNLYETSQDKPHIRYFQGDDIVRVVYEDILATCKKGDVFYRYESPKEYKKIDEWLPKAYFERVCTKKEIQKFVITNERTFKSKKKVVERLERAVPASLDPFTYDITQIIYDNKVAHIDFVSKHAWTIEHARFAQFQRQLFRLLFAKLDR